MYYFCCCSCCYYPSQCHQPTQNHFLQHFCIFNTYITYLFTERLLIITKISTSTTSTNIATLLLLLWLQNNTKIFNNIDNDMDKKCKKHLQIISIYPTINSQYLLSLSQHLGTHKTWKQIWKNHHFLPKIWHCATFKNSYLIFEKR